MASGWAALGKPDFSKAAALVYRLPAELRKQFNKSDQEVLTWTIFFAWTSGYRSGRGGTIASFSQTWLASRFGRSRWTVARALVKLSGLGLMANIRRNPKPDGTFQTNLIALSARITALLGIIKGQVPDKSPCSKTAPQEVKNVYKREERTAAASSASPSLSLSAVKLREREDWSTQPLPPQVEKGFLTKLFLSLKTA